MIELLIVYWQLSRHLLQAQLLGNAVQRIKEFSNYSIAAALGSNQDDPNHLPMAAAL